MNTTSNELSMRSTGHFPCSLRHIRSALLVALACGFRHRDAQDVRISSTSGAPRRFAERAARRPGHDHRAPLGLTDGNEKWTRRDHHGAHGAANTMLDGTIPCRSTSSTTARCGWASRWHRRRDDTRLPVNSIRSRCGGRPGMTSTRTPSRSTIRRSMHRSWVGPPTGLVSPTGPMGPMGRWVRWVRRAGGATGPAGAAGDPGAAVRQVRPVRPARQHSWRDGRHRCGRPRWRRVTPAQRARRARATSRSASSLMRA
jgi:hypothetical protein